MKISDVVDTSRDQKSAEVLNELIEKDLSDALGMRIQDTVLVFGAGHSLAKDAARVKSKQFHKCTTTIAADGAARSLLEGGITPDIIVTDMDGDIRAIIRANKKGSCVVVHAHGDNIEKIKEVVPKLENVVGTTQTEPFGNLHNFGGFTDGDRCVFLAEHFGAGTIVLFGMDFGGEIGEYSGEYEKDIKIRKMELGKKLIEDLAARTGAAILNATSGGNHIAHVPKIGINTLEGII